MTRGHITLMRGMMIGSNPALRPIVAALAGIALFSAMDVAIKAAALVVGAYSAYFLRGAIGLVLIGPVWWWRERRWPTGAVLRLHLLRGTVVTFMGLTFFLSLVRLPLAQAIAISFIAPLIALYLAAIILKEVIRPSAIIAALFGLAGVVVIVGGKIMGEAMDDDAVIGLIAIFASALLYAWNLVLQRQQAMVARPAEVSAFQNGVAVVILGVAAPFLLQMPAPQQWAEIVVGAALAVGAALLLAWAYARAEAQVLVPIEYSGFLWAALLSWLYLGERVTLATFSGAVLIVIGCWIGTRQPRRQSPRPEQSAV